MVKASKNRYKEKQRKQNIKTYLLITGVFIALIVPFIFIGMYALKSNAGFDYSAGIDKNGFWKGIKARDYVQAFDYQAFPIPPEIHTVSDERLNQEIGSVMAGFMTTENVTYRPVEDGDTVNIDYVGSVDGVEFPGGSTGGGGTEVTIGVTSYIDDFLEQLIGHMPGETFDVNVTFPDEYQEPTLEGKDAVFVTTINFIVESTTPDITDAFVLEQLNEEYGWTTVDEMIESIQTTIRKSAISQYVQEYCVKELNLKPTPEKMVEHQLNVTLKNYQNYANYSNMSFTDFLSQNFNVASEEQFIEVYRDKMVESATFSLVLQSVAESAGIRVNNDDLAKFFGGDSEDFDISNYEKVYGIPYMKQLALFQKAYELIIENAVLM